MPEPVQALDFKEQGTSAVRHAATQSASVAASSGSDAIEVGFVAI
jgi:hypothetical protein